MERTVSTCGKSSSLPRQSRKPNRSPRRQPMTDYQFVTIWKVDAPIQTVFDAILHSERWPSWWRAITEVQEVQPGQPDGIGNERRYTWRTSLPYGLTFNVRVVRIDAPRLLEGNATGELMGTGLWRLRQEGDVMFLRYDSRERAAKQWMNILSPIKRPLVEDNSDVRMLCVCEG